MDQSQARSLYWAARMLTNSARDIGNRTAKVSAVQLRNLEEILRTIGEPSIQIEEVTRG